MISTLVCIYLKGIEISPVGMPDLVIWIALASVGVGRGSAIKTKGIFSFFAISINFLVSFGYKFGPILIDTPEPK